MKCLTKKNLVLEKLRSPLFKDSLFQLILNSGTTLITFIQIPLLIKALSLSGFGYLVIYQTVGAIWSCLTIAQINQGVLAFSPANPNKDQIIKWSSKMTTLNYLLSMVIFYAISIQAVEIISKKVPSIENIEVLALIPIVLSSPLVGSPFLGSVYRVQSRYQEYMALQLITALTRLGLIYYCMQLNINIIGIAWIAFLGPEVFKITFMWLRIKKDLKMHKKPENALKLQILRLSAAMNLHAISDLPTQQLDKFILLPIVGVENIGIYQSIKRIGLLTSMITGPFSGSLFHEYSKLANIGKQALAITLFHKTITPFIMVTGLFSFTLWATRTLWIPIILPGAQISEEALAGILVLYCIASSFVGLHPLLIALKSVKKSLAITAASNMLFFSVAALLAQKLETLGVIAALYAQIGSILLMKYWIARQYMEKPCCSA